MQQVSVPPLARAEAQIVAALSLYVTKDAMTPCCEEKGKS